MIRPLTVFLSALLFPAQIATPPQAVHPRYVVIDDNVRAEFAADWNDADPYQHERAYCLAYVISERWGVPVYRVWAAARAEEATSTPSSITYRCPEGDGIATMHVHPETSCIDATHCVWGGPDAWQCQASDVDEATLQASGEPFALIECDRFALVPYFPHPVR